MIEFSHEYTAGKLVDVSSRMKPTFAALVAERLLPNARLFFHKNGHQFLRTAENALELLWQFGAGVAIEENERRRALAECMAVIDRAEDSDAEDAPLASDAVSAIAYGLRAIGNNDPKEPAWAAQRAFDAVFRFAEGRSPENASLADIEVHPVVQRELERQRGDIALLKNIGEAEDIQTINSLRDAARHKAETVFSAGGAR